MWAMDVGSVDKLFVLCTVVAIIGTAALYFHAQSLAPRAIAIAEVDLMQPGSYVSIAGVIERVKEREKTFSIEVCDTSACITISIFKNLAKDILLIEGNEIVIYGVVRDYAGRRYIEVKSSTGIKILNTQ